MGSTEAERKKIEQQEAALAKRKARFLAKARKERTAQLVASGVLVEVLYSGADETAKAKWRSQASQNLKGNTLARSLAMFDRLDREKVSDHDPETQSND